MVKALSNLAGRALARVLPQNEAAAACACPAGTSSWCSGGNLYTRTCCSWNCAVAPTCTTYVIIGAC
ncbi:hypothetical protein ACGFMM_32340 [Streptomyces sp. NPDC048604]|uniref:hypothetical protein n=1 Tax=Streptomyces sp. NPDC048604 TaxID=3365578 RepID=UPI003711718B